MHRGRKTTSRVAVEPLARTAAADLPSGRVVAAGGAAHHHAPAFEVQHRVMTSDPAHQLSDPAGEARHDAAGLLERDFRYGRELLGVIRNHHRYPSFCSVRTRNAARPFPS